MTVGGPGSESIIPGDDAVSRFGPGAAGVPTCCRGSFVARAPVTVIVTQLGKLTVESEAAARVSSESRAVPVAALAAASHGGTVT